MVERTRVAGRGPRAGEPPRSGAVAGEEADPEQVARAVGLRLLTDAPRSRAELGQAMARKGVPDDVAARVLDRFGEVGLIDDAEYAAMLVRSRHAERGLAAGALRAELRRRGVDDAVAQQALGELSAQDQEAMARRLVARKLASTAGLDTPTRVRRTVAALGRKGYPPGLVGRLVRAELAAEGAALADEDLPID